MPAKRSVYGRRTARKDDRTMQCFASSITPVKPDVSQSIYVDDCFWLNSPHANGQVESPTTSLKSFSVKAPQNHHHWRVGHSPTPSPSPKHNARALKSRNSNPSYHSPSASPEKLHCVECEGTVEQQSPALIAAELRNALRSQPCSAAAVGVNASPNGTISSIHGTPSSNTRSSARRRQRMPESFDFTSYRTSPPTSPSAAPLQTRRATMSTAVDVHLSTPQKTYIDHTAPLLALSNDVNARMRLQPFQAWADSLDEYLHIQKIAEASYGEVYRLSPKDRSLGFSRSDDSVVKLIALKPPPTMPSKRTKAQQDRVADMSAIEDVSSEVRLLQRMSDVPGFANFRDCRVLQGRLPSQLVHAWRQFHRHVKKSEFPDPGRRGSYEEAQLWAVVEMGDAGRDIETICDAFTCSYDSESDDTLYNPLREVWGVWDVFWGVALAAAKGEEWAAFEHRDLHPGNICIKFPRKAAEGLEQHGFNADRNLGFTGVETTLIDYTLSRADLGSAHEIGEAYHDESVAYYDLAKDPSIFEGDGEEDYQYDIYRHMRAVVMYGDPISKGPSQPKKRAPKGPEKSRRQDHDEQQEQHRIQSSRWKAHHPLTNLVWLHFLLYKLTEQLGDWPSSHSPPPVATKNDEKVDARREKGLDLERKLQKLTELLDLEKMLENVSEMGIASAKELVSWAVEARWFSEQDALGIPEEALGDLNQSHETCEQLEKVLEEKLRLD